MKTKRRGTLTYKSMSVFVTRTTQEAKISELIQRYGNRDSHLSMSVVDVAPLIPAYAYGYHYGGFPYSPDWQEEISVRGEEVSKKADVIKRQLQSAGVSGDVATHYCESSQVEQLVAQRAELSDVAMLSRSIVDDQDLFDRIFSGIIFGSNVGVMVMDSQFTAPVKSEHVFIAWDSSKASGASVHVALPLLLAADKVTIGVFDPEFSKHDGGEEPGADLAAWLSRHDCNVEIQQYPSGGTEIATCIQGRALEVGCDLVVMGAYGHSKLKQQILGGTTSSMLNQSTLPVLFAH